MKVAIVGSGISGLTAAYYLRNVHDIHLFEAQPEAGGHTRTISVLDEYQELNLDTGFMVYNTINYPGFSKLIRELGVQSQYSDMSFGVNCRKCDFEYGNRGLSSMLSQPSALKRLSWLTIPFEMRRFYQDARSLLASPEEEITLEEFLQQGHYSNELVRHLIIPLVSAVWSTPPVDVNAYPAKYLFRFMDNHCMLSFTQRRAWQTIKGGGHNYVNALIAALPNGIQLNQPVICIKRASEGVILSFAKQPDRVFDAVIVATHSDQAVKLLEGFSSEQKALMGFKYSESDVCLHTDSSIMPKRSRAWCSWNYQTEECAVFSESTRVTYHLNRLQQLKSSCDYFVSLNMSDRIDEKLIITEFKQTHPVFTRSALESQANISDLNYSSTPIFFAGAYLGHGFHEDGFQSGFSAADALITWSKSFEAKS